MMLRKSIKADGGDVSAFVYLVFWTGMETDPALPLGASRTTT
jgi:hypothetical protein